ncbi:MAG: superoxide dismutase [Planctomycetota bacterium]
MAFEVPPLTYAYDALEPYINKRTMELHHDLHHAAYVNKFNAAVEGTPLAAKTAEEIVTDLASVPENIRGAVRNHGGGHVNHALFWSIMGPNKGGEPSGELGEALKSVFGSFANFQEEFNTKGGNQFGSGWVWLVMTSEGKLQVQATPNQDTPLSEGKHVIMGNDVWEHAYYLTYENRRPEYLKAWWNVVDWDVVGARFARAKVAAK